MAFSVTVDSQFWDDPRLEDLILILGEQRALGACLLAFYLSRKYWLRDERLIPEAVWKARKIPECLIDTGFAERKPEGIRVDGVEKFAEQYQRAVSKARLGADARWNKKPKENNKPVMPEGLPEAMQQGLPEAMRKQCHLDLDLDSNLKKEEREKKPPHSSGLGAITEFRGNAMVEHFLSQVRCEVQTAWVSMYGNPEWIRNEILSAIVWERSNPSKAWSNRSQGMSNWLRRSYREIEQKRGAVAIPGESELYLDTESS